MPARPATTTAPKQRNARAATPAAAQGRALGRTSVIRGAGSEGTSRACSTMTLGSWVVAIATGPGSARIFSATDGRTGSLEARPTIGSGPSSGGMICSGGRAGGRSVSRFSAGSRAKGSMAGTGSLPSRTRSAAASISSPGGLGKRGQVTCLFVRQYFRCSRCAAGRPGRET
jgi:hypothetical protein